MGETLVGAGPNDIFQQAEQVGEEWGDGGCWSEVITGAKQRASLVALYPDAERPEKFRAISEVLSQIHGHHDDKKAKTLCQQLESIIPLSSK